MLRVYKCKVCGNIVVKIKDSGLDMSCCDRPMTELKPGMTDGLMEKHVPVVERLGNTVKVKVGAEEHPMTDVHHIEFIIAETTKGYHICYLGGYVEDQKRYEVECKKGCFDKCKPEASFVLKDKEELLAVYEYCNLHGLYMTEC